ncbi:S8 family peptidase [Bradyrhizobium commune]|uniref:S8 family peptidase n=1 Tax=Bradyrhizobium commune TaxID=83627 RepID=UPI001FEE17AA|nr:CARDB domain-containing protein [Bradyrhizobium commune]
MRQSLNESASNADGTGIKVGVLSDSFNDLGGYANDQASGTLPSVQVLADLSSGGTDEGRAMLQIVHDIAPNASLAFYTADQGEQAFANGILALAAAGCKVICDDVTYLDEPFFGGGVIAQAIQTVEAEGVTYITSAGNNASTAYQAAWTPVSGYFNGYYFSDAQLFGSSVFQTLTITASASEPVPLLLEWDKAYGQANFNSGQAPDIDMFVYQNGSLIAQATNATVGEPNNPFTGYEFTASGTYQIVIANNFGPDPHLIKEILFGNGLPETISGANAGTVMGHALSPYAITVGAVSTAATPAFGYSTPVSESFSSSGAGSELLFDSNGAALPSPQFISPVDVSSVDNIATTLSGGLGDFYGTSAASASLAGVAAVILGANPSLSPAQLAQIMEQTATSMANPAVSGSGLVNVDAAVAAAVALLPPDLSEYVAVNKTTVAAGGSLTIDAYNMNLGSGSDATSTTAGIYLSTDATITTSDTLLTTLTTTSTLARVSQPGYYDHQTVTVTLPGNLAPGTYYIGGIADYNNQLSESNETNNTYNVVQVTVTAPALPDLSEYVAVNKTTVAAGDSVTVDAYNMNLGGGVDATSTTAGIYLSTDATITTSDTLLTTLTTSATLATVSQPGYYDHQTVTVMLPGNLAPGTYYIGGIADYNNHLTESNETNNTYNVVQVTVTAPVLPDLSEYVAVNKTTVAAGDSVTIDAYNMNLGNGVDATPTTAGIYLSTDATITTSDTLLTTLTTSSTLATVSQPGYYDHQTVTVTLPGNLAPGTYYIGGLADYNSHLTESNETNNTYNVVQVTVTAPVLPDLSEYVAVNKTTVAAGNSVTIDAYNMNLGNGVDATPTTAGIYLSTDATITTSDTLLTTLTTSSTLATVSQPGYYDHQTVTVTLPGNLAPGTYYIGGIADYNNHLAESSETNNTYNVVQITVTAAGSSSVAQVSAASSSGGAAYFGQPNVYDNFVLAQVSNVQSLGGTSEADHVSLTTTALPQAPAATTDVAAAHFVSDHVTDVMQHSSSDFHLL